MSLLIKHNCLLFLQNDKDEEDTISMTSLDPKTKEWVVKSAKCDYQALAKLASENPRIAKFKDPITSYTALHWAAKHGNMDLVKMLAGTYTANVNAKTNGGYTPCHLALQFGHEEIYKILVESYGADPNVRDYSGRKPRQYQTNQDTSLSADTYRRLLDAERTTPRECPLRKALRLRRGSPSGHRTF
ncbi:ankyrin repeat domain-containing protein SOWAHC isoform X2 [Acyrthosiphon pisum]|uniref:Ankyrin repeat domain-containing protein SOWAHC n=1 Tax=Acyrthosiphon pisum TaxID=7029 RepID=A0A8R2H9E6_ACYPI|nr:ankyrin repeat domain-containing protein SOWAHC isoform X2 [Acyrthosiphon pisum]|eukprot:XP_016663542.1 PREDICTED: ankyrin repeat domain-containing protein SOWAHC isoform X2 [Acyrthosiphon pisum]